MNNLHKFRGNSKLASFGEMTFFRASGLPHLRQGTGTTATRVRSAETARATFVLIISSLYMRGNITTQLCKSKEKVMPDDFGFEISHWLAFSAGTSI
jgi:hypothetical protein